MVDLAGLIRHPEPAPYPFGPDSIADILDEGLRSYPNRLALIDRDRTWTWVQLDAVVEDIAAGITPGELRWWSLGNCAEQIIGVLATFRAGAIWVAAPGQDPGADLPTLIERLGPITVVDSVPPGYRCVQPQMPNRHLASHRTRTPMVGRQEPAVVMFTSGTTGTPKAVVHSQHNLLGPGLVSIEVEPPRPGERIGTPLDLGNANITALGPISALLRGSTFVVLPSRHAPRLGASIDAYSVTRLFAVPTLAFDLAESDEVSVDQLRSLDRVILGGSGADPAVLQRFADRFAIRPTLSYGMSEAPTGVVRESFDDPIGSGRGFPLPHVEIEILDSHGAKLDTGNDGEICLRPASAGHWANCWTGTLGYIGEAEQSAALFRGGVLHTGDRGHLDADGALFVTGRLSDIIVRGGKNIDPLEIEERLRALPGVREALVVPFPDERLGQKLGALLVLDGDVRPDEFEGIDVDPLELVDAFEVVDELPRNPLGKVIRVRPDTMFIPVGPHNLD